MVASLLAYGFAADPYNTTIGINTTGVSSDGVLLDVNAPASMSFNFDFTQPGSTSQTDLEKANWTAFQLGIVASNTAKSLKPTGQESYVITVASNANYQLVVGVPTATGTGFDLDRYLLTITWPTLSGTSIASRALSAITAPWTAVTGSPGPKSYTLKLTVYVKPSDVPSNYNQTISIPLTIVSTP
jgi:hypothetical protein